MVWFIVQECLINQHVCSTKSFIPSPIYWNHFTEHNCFFSPGLLNWGHSVQFNSMLRWDSKNNNFRLYLRRQGVSAFDLCVEWENPVFKQYCAVSALISDKREGFCKEKNICCWRNYCQYTPHLQVKKTLSRSCHNYWWNELYSTTQLWSFRLWRSVYVACTSWFFIQIDKIVALT